MVQDGPSERLNSLDYVSARRHTSFLSTALNHDPSLARSQARPEGGAENGPLPQLNNSKPSSRSVRLSLSMDGKAQVVKDEGALRWSERRPSQIVNERTRSLQRSQSALLPGQHLDSILHTPALPLWSRKDSVARMKSRQPWEPYSEGDHQDRTSLGVEKEKQASAAESVSILKRNPSAALSTNSNKRNGLLFTEVASKRVKTSKKPGLARASSSMARLQTQAKKPSDKPKQYVSMESPWDDSDKENIAPDGYQVQPRRARPVRRSSRQSSAQPILGGSAADGRRLDRNAGNRSRYSKGNRPSEVIFEDENQQYDPAVNKDPVETTHDCVRLHNEEELNCVQSLLSLSQGSWQ